MNNSKSRQHRHSGESSIIGGRLLHGFTIIELLVVVAIIGILAAVGIPQYNDYLVKGKLADAANLLSELQLRQEQYYQDNRAYSNGMTPRNTSTAYTASCVTTNGGQGFTCTATPAAGTGLGFRFTVKEDGTKATIATSPDLGWAIPSTNCWARSKSGC